MGFRSFRFQVSLRVIILAGTIFMSIWVFPKTAPIRVIAYILALLALFQVYSLIYYVDQVNRKLAQFFQSIRYDDFTISYPPSGLGKSFSELQHQFHEVTQQFLKLRAEKEEHLQYLNTLVQHVGVGVISFCADGEVELFNHAAKRILNIAQPKNIKSLSKISPDLIQTMLRIKSGESALVKVTSLPEPIMLSLRAAEFKRRDQGYTLVSFQNIQNEIDSELMRQELEIAWKVQKSLLPAQPPSIPGFEINGFCRPAREVGGDYFDILPIDEDHYAVVIGDVSGKGTAAAFYMTLTKGILLSHLKTLFSAKEILIHVNAILSQTISSQSFVTMFIGILNCRTRQLNIARAGHNAAIWCRPGEKNCRLVRPPGIALGIQANSNFAESLLEETISLAAGDMFVLYTDGFTDALNEADEEFGSQRLQEKIFQLRSLKPAVLIEKLFAEVDQFTHKSEAADDMTIVCIQASGQP